MALFDSGGGPDFSSGGLSAGDGGPDSGGGGLDAGSLGGVAKAAGSLFGGSGGGNAAAAGYDQEANLYDQAAQLGRWDEMYHQESGDVQGIMATRQGMKTIGAQKAAVGASGFQESGSNLYLLRDSTAQLGVTKGMINLQTSLNVANDAEKVIGYEAQAQGARTQAAAARAASSGGMMGSIMGALGPLAGLL
jgi:hypothetical protein